MGPLNFAFTAFLLPSLSPAGLFSPSGRSDRFISSAFTGTAASVSLCPCTFFSPTFAAEPSGPFFPSCFPWKSFGLSAYPLSVPLVPQALTVLRSFIQNSVPFVTALLCTQPASLPASPLSLSGLQLRPGHPKLHPAILLSVPLSLPLLTAFSRLTPALACAQPVSSAFSIPRLSARSSLALCFFPSLGFPGFPGSRFLFPSAFASVRTSSARIALDLAAFLPPMDLHPPSGTLSPFPHGPGSRPFAVRPLVVDRFAFRAASLSLASADDFLSSGFHRATRRCFLAICFSKQIALQNCCFQLSFASFHNFCKLCPLSVSLKHEA